MVPLTERGRRNLLIALTIAVAATRLYALSRTMWDWDEALFACAVRHFDVSAHHPHPPGFPLFIATAKLVHLVVPDAFQALRAVSVIASLFLFPALYHFARALRFPFVSSVIAAVRLRFSRMSGFTAGQGSATSSRLSFFWACAALCAIAAGRQHRGLPVFAATMLVRPQNVLLAYPWIVASWRRIRRRRGVEVASERSRLWC
jgi:hypothetical protein